MSAATVIALVTVTALVLAYSYAYIRYRQICKQSDERDGS